MDEELARQVDQVLKAKDTILLEATRQYLATLRPAIRSITENIREPRASRRLIYQCIAKRVEETLSSVIAIAESPHAFTGSLMLRPLCEDLIYGCWLAAIPAAEADEFVKLSMQSNMLKSLRAQTNFLPRAYAKYTFLPDAELRERLGDDAERSEDFIAAQNEIIDAEHLQCKAHLTALGRKLGWPRGRVPTTASMAKQCGLEEIYDFFYHGTSKGVHSDPHVMRQMISHNSDGSHSISSATRRWQHARFALTYGLWLAAEIFACIIEPNFREECSVIDDQACSVWLALVLVGLARNRAYPLLVTAAEEFAFLRSFDD